MGQRPGALGTAPTGLSPLGLEVRRHDRDRFVTALFAPADRRESLFALYAFSAELARIRDSVSEPLLGEIRLQWWRDTVTALFNDVEVAHPVAIGLGMAIRDHRISRDHLDRLIDARTADLVDDSPADLAALEAYVEGTAGTLAVLAVEALGAREPGAAEAAHHAGMAWGLTGILRATPFRARAGRSVLPADLMEVHRLTVESSGNRFRLSRHGSDSQDRRGPGSASSKPCPVPTCRRSASRPRGAPDGSADRGLSLPAQACGLQLVGYELVGGPAGSFAVGDPVVDSRLLSRELGRRGHPCGKVDARPLGIVLLTLAATDRSATLIERVR